MQFTYLWGDDCFNSIQNDLNLEEFEDVRFSVSERLGPCPEWSESGLESICNTVDNVYHQDLTDFNYNIKDSLHFRKMNYAPR